MIDRLGLGPIRQLSYLTDDMDASVRAWMTQLGVGPFTVFRGVQLEGEIDGAPTQIHMDVGFTFQGELQIELIQQTNDAPSPYRHRYHAGVLGLHHVGYLSDDMDGDLARLRRAGLEAWCTLGNEHVGRYVYCKSAELPEVYVELLENTPVLQATWDHQRQAAANWDGSPDAVTELKFS